jgi:acetolactate synthase I/II/III large subunit
VRSDADPNYKPAVELIGNVKETLARLTWKINPIIAGKSLQILGEIAMERGVFGERAWLLNGTPIHPMRLVHELRGIMSDDMTLCLDMGSFHIWLARYLYSFRARQVKALDMQGPVVIGVPVDYSDNHKLMKIMHPGSLK